MSLDKKKVSYTVMRPGVNYVIVGTDLTYQELQAGTSKAKAQELCDVLNGINKDPAKPSEAARSFKRPKSTEPAGARPFYEPKGAPGIAYGDLERHNADVAIERTLSALPDHQRPAARKRIERALKKTRTWLPPLCRDWADQLAEHCGYGGSKRGDLLPIDVKRLIRSHADDGVLIPRLAIDPWPAMLRNPIKVRDPGPAPFKSEDVRAVHDTIWPDGTDLIVHYVSNGSADQKADYFDVSKSTYLRRIKIAHETVAIAFLTDTVGYSEFTLEGSRRRSVAGARRDNAEAENDHLDQDDPGDEDALDYGEGGYFEEKKLSLK